MDTLIFPPVITSVPIFGTQTSFPVRRIFCVGRNYTEHAREMGNDERDPPFFFTKPSDAVVRSGVTLPYPKGTESLHHEAELVVAIGESCSDVSVEQAEDAIFGYACGNDLTRRDIQAIAKAAKRPWDMSKGFDQSAVIGDIHLKTTPLRDATITCHVDGVLKQTGNISDMIWSVAEVISTLSGLVDLRPGDLIMTGTPAGVGPVAPGETCEVQVGTLSPAKFTYVD
ncbi:MAG: fumarylacetoacetate hydrolase family protein [Planktomarina sp.]